MNDSLRNKINDMVWDLTFQLTKLGYALQQHERSSEEKVICFNFYKIT